MELIINQYKNWFIPLFDYLFEFCNNVYIIFLDINDYFLENHLYY